MNRFYSTQSSAIQDGDFNPNDDGKLFAKQLVSSIARGEKHISLTLTGKSVLAFARELSQCILAENATTASKEKDDQKKRPYDTPIEYSYSSANREDIE